MKLSRRTLLLLSLTAGCSGSGGPSTPTGILFALDWPDASRALPLAAKSVRVQIKQGSKVLATRIFLAGPDSEEQLTDLPFAVALTLEAVAYPTVEGTSAPLSSATIPFSLLKGKLERLTLSLTSVISTVVLSSVTDGAQTMLTATAHDSVGSAVLTAPAQWEWSTSDTALGSLAPSGPTAVFTEAGFGVATLTAREKESGKSANLIRPICSGDPTPTPPQVASFPLSGTFGNILAVGNGQFVVAHGSTLSCVESSGALVWQRALPTKIRYIMGHALGGFLGVYLEPQDQIRIHRISDGAFFWQATQNFGREDMRSVGDTRLFGFQFGTEPPLLQGRELNTGTVLWSQPLSDDAQIVWADPTRILCYNSISGAYIAFGAERGTPLWEVRVPTGSLFAGAQTTGSGPLFYSLTGSELRALYFSNGARIWTVGTGGEQGYLTQDQRQLIVYSRTACSAHDPATGNTLWSRSGLSRVVGALPNGDLVVLPQPAIPGCLPLQVLRPADGTVRWSNYLPTSPMPGDSFVCRVAGSLICINLSGFTAQGTTPLFALDSATGQYVWGTRQYGPNAEQPPGALDASDKTLALIADSGTRVVLLH